MGYACLHHRDDFCHTNISTNTSINPISIPSSSSGEAGVGGPITNFVFNGPLSSDITDLVGGEPQDYYGM